MLRPFCLAVFSTLVQLAVAPAPPLAEVTYQSGPVINHNDFSPSLADGTDWGTIYDNSGGVARVYTLANLGDSNLQLGNSPGRVYSSTARWVAGGPSSTSIGGSSSLTFTVSYANPGTSGHGLHRANLSVNLLNDDLGRNPFVFTIQAFHFVRTWEPHFYCLNDVEVTSGDLPSASAGTDFGSCRLGVTYILNCKYVNNGNFNVTTDTFVVDSPSLVSVPSFPQVVEPAPKEFPVQIRLTSTSLGQVSSDISWNYYAPLLQLFILSVRCQGQDAIAETYFGSVRVAAGAVSNLTLGTAFGIASSAVSSDRTFILANAGNLGGLTSTISFTGPHAADFNVLVAPTANVGAGSNVTFTIRFLPTGLGSRSATLNVNSGATGYPSSFSFFVSGTGVSATPKLLVRNGGTAIVNGETGTAATDIGASRVGAGTVYQNFTLRNDATAALTLPGNVLITGTGFSIFRQPAMSIPALGASYFTVAWIPSPGQQSAVITINSNDATTPVFTFTIRGFGQFPAIQVTGNGNIIPIGSTGGRMADLTDWGIFNPAGLSNTLDHNFIIENIGSSTLSLTGSPNFVTISGPNAGDFGVGAQPSSGLLAPGARSNFIIRLISTNTDLLRANVTILNDDAARSTFYFEIRATGESGSQMVIYGLSSGLPIQPGARYPNSYDDTDFGFVQAAGNQVRTYEIQTRGSSGFELFPDAANCVKLTGSSDWTLSQIPGQTNFGGVSSGDSATFTVRFAPTVVGYQTAIVTVQSDDPRFPAPNYYNFLVGGFGGGPEFQLRSSNGVQTPRGDTTPTTNKGTDVGSVIGIDRIPAVSTIYMHNMGTTDINVTTVTSSNPDFRLSPNGTSLVPKTDFTGLPYTPTGRVPLQISFLPSGAPTSNQDFRTATITIIHSDTARSPFTFTVRGRNVGQVPDAPTSVIAVADTSTTATIAFTAPAYDGGSPITSYRVSLTPSIGAPQSGTASPIQLVGLQPGATYSVTVQAGNRFDLGQASTPAILKMPDGPANDGFITGDLGADIGIVVGAVVILGVGAILCFRKKVFGPSKAAQAAGKPVEGQPDTGSEMAKKGEKPKKEEREMLVAAAL